MKLKKTLTLFFLGLTTLGLLACEKSYTARFGAHTYFDDSKVVALCLAAEKGDISKIDQLIKQGVDINTIGLRGFNPLYWLFAHGEESLGQKRAFAYLLKQGADAMQANTDTDDPLLHFTVRAEDSDYLKMILMHGQNLDLDYVRPGNSWSTPMMRAIVTDRFDNLAMLIEAGADLEKKNEREETALLMSTSGNWQETIMLLEAGADYTVKRRKGQTIVDDIENHLYYPPADGTKDYLDGRSDYRQQVIDFLREKGVEVSPWTPEKLENKEGVRTCKRYSGEVGDIYDRAYIEICNFIDTKEDGSPLGCWRRDDFCSENDVIKFTCLYNSSYEYKKSPCKNGCFRGACLQN